jgi:hypothetical protein
LFGTAELSSFKNRKERKKILFYFLYFISVYLLTLYFSFFFLFFCLFMVFIVFSLSCLSVEKLTHLRFLYSLILKSTLCFIQFLYTICALFISRLFFYFLPSRFFFILSYFFLLPSISVCRFLTVSPTVFLSV